MDFISSLKAIKSKTWFIPAAVLLAGVVIIVSVMVGCGKKTEAKTTKISDVDILKSLPANNDKNSPRRTVEDVVFSETRGKWKWSSSSNLVIAESESKWDYSYRRGYAYGSYVNGTIRLTFELSPSKKSYRFLEYKYRCEETTFNENFKEISSGVVKEFTDKGPFYDKLTRML